MSERDLEVVVFGATGVTGRRVVAYLAERAGDEGGRWAAAARDLAKLDRTLGEIGAGAPELIAADVDDPGSLRAMASRARVVLNLVGPYTDFGRPVVEACVDAGADYVDLTGEVPFVRRMIDELDDRAREQGVKVVPICGFESLPPDLAVLLAAEIARDRHDEELAEVDLEVAVRPPPGMPRPSDILSGGTSQSIAAIAGDEEAAGVTDPAVLIIDPVRAEAVRRRSPIPLAPRRGTGGAVIAPMLPAAFINPAVIQRTAALLAAEGESGEEPFSYREGFALRGRPVSLPLRYATAGTLSATQAVMGAMTRARPSVRRRVSRALRRVMPSSGFGPAADRIENWSWEMLVSARTTGGHRIGVEVQGDGHPGYLTTARMLGEAGLLLAEPGLTPDRSGFLTPATALGTGGLERFELAGLRFRVGDRIGAPGGHSQPR